MRCLHCLHPEEAHTDGRCRGDARYREKCACRGYAPQAVPVTITETPSKFEDLQEDHPSYAVAILSRPSSTGTRLAGSDVEHRTFMEVSIKRASMYRSHHADRWSPHGRELVTFCMSASQWAAFISSQGEGTGTPCTLEVVDGTRQPEIAAPPDRMARLREEVAQRMAEPTARLAALTDLLGGIKMTRADREAIRVALAMLGNALTPNIAFTADAVSEHLEATRDRVVAEAEAHVAKLVAETGRAVLRGEGEALVAALRAGTEGLPAIEAAPVPDAPEDPS